MPLRLTRLVSTLRRAWKRRWKRRLKRRSQRGGRADERAHAPGSRGAGGFTLIEVTMAGAILAVGATGVLAAYSTTMGLVEHQRRLATATNVTASKLEDILIADPASSLLTPGTNGPEILDGLGRPPVLGASETYEVRWTVTVGRPSSGYAEVVVETRWVEMRGSRFTRFAAYRELR